MIIKQYNKNKNDKIMFQKRFHKRSKKILKFDQKQFQYAFKNKKIFRNTRKHV